MDPAWWVVRGPHGGYLSAVMLRAMTDTLGDPARAPRSFTTHFASAPAEGDIDIEVRVERSGRSASFVAARAYQDDKTRALSLCAFSSEWPSKLEFQHADLPEVPAPEEAPSLAELIGEGAPPFLRNFDMRPTWGGAPFSGQKKAELGGWFRLSPPEIADAHAIACLMDAWAPVVFPVATEPFVAPTVDFTVHFRRPLPLAGAGPNDYYLGKFGSIAAQDGFFEEDGTLWAADGTLVAQSRQLALMIWV